MGSHGIRVQDARRLMLRVNLQSSTVPAHVRFNVGPLRAIHFALCG